MKEQEIENLIRKTFKLNTKPSEESFSKLLFEIKENPTFLNNTSSRHSFLVTMSNIIRRRSTEFTNTWKNRRAYVLVPTFIVLLVVGAFSLSPSENSYSRSIIKLAEQNESIKEPVVKAEEPLAYTMFYSSTINDLNKLENEI